jgi:hypothetical protein
MHTSVKNHPVARDRQRLPKRMPDVFSLRVHSGTARPNAGAYTSDMELASIKFIIAMLWVLAVAIAGIAGHSDSLSSWAFLVGVAIVPPLVMMWRWSDPRQTMSEAIQEALR